MQTQAGFTLVELLIAILLIVSLLVPAMETLQSATHSGSVARDGIQRDRALRDKLDEVLALPFDTLAAATSTPDTVNDSYSDPADTVPRRVVYLAHYDGDATGIGADPFLATEVDTDLVWVRVAHAGESGGLTTLVRR